MGSKGNKRKRGGKPETAALSAPRLPLVLISLAILLVLVARVRLLNVPLERDEGEYAYIGNLMLQGIAPYGLAANMKLPGTNAAYALLMAIFGRSIFGVHFGFLLVNLGAIALIFFIARRLFGVQAGIAASASYAVMTVGVSVLGLWAHATHFVVLPALAATLLLLQWADDRKLVRLAAAGVLFGLAFLMKQPGIFLLLFGLIYVMHIRRSLKDAAVFTLAAALPFGLTCLLLWRAGVFSRFWLWVFTYARLYASRVPISGAFGPFWTSALPILIANLGICLLAAAGMYFLWTQPDRRAAALPLTVFVVCSFLAVCPGFYFRQHYFVLVLPAVALLVGAFMASARPALAPWLTVVALAYSIVTQAGWLFGMSPEAVSRAAYGLNPFPEAIPIGDYIRTHSSATDQIAILGSEPEIYFYSQRRAAVPYVYTYPLVEPQPLAGLMQTEFIHDVEAAKPAYLVYVNIYASWLVQSGSPTDLFRWAVPYYTPRYQQVGVVELSPRGTTYRWDADATGYRPLSSDFVLILKRRD